MNLLFFDYPPILKHGLLKNHPFGSSFIVPRWPKNVREVFPSTQQFIVRELCRQLSQISETNACINPMKSCCFLGKTTICRMVQKQKPNPSKSPDVWLPSSKSALRITVLVKSSFFPMFPVFSGQRRLHPSTTGSPGGALGAVWPVYSATRSARETSTKTSLSWGTGEGRAVPHS